MKIKTSLTVAMLLILSACGGSIADRTNKALGTAIVATNSARDQFTEWDAQHQLDIVDKATTREAAESGLKDYRARRQRIVQAFTVAYTSMATAAATVPLVQAGKKSDRDIIKLLIDAITAVQLVVSSVEEIRSAFESIPSEQATQSKPPNSEPAIPTVAVPATGA